jgi:hypothetical protein
VVDRAYRDLSDAVYDVDKLKVKDIGEGEILKGKYKILSLEDNQNNGMQVMAVALINSVGEFDISKIIIV